jgi:hypothetical protein
MKASMATRELRKSIEQAHVLELNRLSILKCADPRRNLMFANRVHEVGNLEVLRLEEVPSRSGRSGDWHLLRAFCKKRVQK